MHARQGAVERGGDGLRALAALLFQAAILGYAYLGLLELPRTGAALMAGAALCNALALLMNRFKLGTRTIHAIAPLWGVGAWAGLIHVTGGVGRSPFVAGLWFEVVLSAICSRPAGVLGVSGLSVAALLLQQARIGFWGLQGALPLQTSLLVLVGAATALLRHRFLRRQEHLAARLNTQQERLATIETQLVDARTLAAVGGQAARLGHGLKNAVHSLRGFASLIDRRLGGAEGHEALDGLRAAIDDLESLASETLHPPAPASASATRMSGSDLTRAIQSTAHDLSRCYPDVRCHMVCDEEPVAINVSHEVLRDVMSNLLRNAAEAMAGHGAVTVRIGRRDRRCEIDVTDEGPGIAPHMRDQLFRPGKTSKANGHGMGLYIVRNLVEQSGGAVSEVATKRGASFRVSWPQAREA